MQQQPSYHEDNLRSRFHKLTAYEINKKKKLKQQITWERKKKEDRTIFFMFKVNSSFNDHLFNIREGNVILQQTNSLADLFLICKPFIMDFTNTPVGQEDIKEFSARE